jgi:chemotaxis protein MotB
MSEIDISDDEKSEGSALPPIIKKVKKHGHGHHGGAWKIAFADFVTAMMAFFLLMWLIASLNKSQKAAIADYFKQPVRIAIMGGESYGNRDVNVKGGGPDIDSRAGQVKATSKPLEAKDKDTELNDKNVVQTDHSSNPSPSQEDIKKLEALKAEINASIEKDPALAGLKKQLRMDIVKEGLRIQLIDNENKPMFDVGSDKVNPSFAPILANIAKLINSVPNKVTIQGHTDSSPYSNPEELDYTNWELSSQRANAARRALVSSGMDDNKVMDVTGFSSTVLLDPKNPLNPENRRISIIVMKKSAEDLMNSNNQQ